MNWNKTVIIIASIVLAVLAYRSTKDPREKEWRVGIAAFLGSIAIAVI